MVNHLIMGLGGTGGRVLAAFRRRMIEHLGEIETDKYSLDFLYVDSKQDDIDAAQKTYKKQLPGSIWRTQGRSAALERRQCLLLEPGSFLSVLDNPADFSNRITSWLGDLQTWKDIWAGTPNGIVAGGQIRRFGRYLLANSIDQFDEAFNNNIDALRTSGGRTQRSTAEAYVHIVAGLAGGTGSGTFIDAVMRVRALTKNSPDYKVILYLVLPETEQAKWATENYYANGYAALTELNALLTSNFAPHDISGRADANLADVPVDHAFIITNRTQNGELLDVSSALPDAIAETMYQTIILSGEAQDAPASKSSQEAETAGHGGGNWKQVMWAENRPVNAEKDFQPLDGEPPAPYVRAVRFATFGAKRIAIPIEEIREFLIYSFAREALLQLLYNRWVDGKSYARESQGKITPLKVNAPLERDWGINVAQLRLDKPYLPQDPSDWSSPNGFFEKLVKNQLQALLAERAKSKKTGWGKLDPLGTLRHAAEQAFADSYRDGKGVEDFYRGYEEEQRSRCHYSRDKIEQDLFQIWQSGSIGLAAIGATIEALLSSLDRKATTLEKEIRGLEARVMQLDAALNESVVRFQKSQTTISSLLGGAKRSDEEVNRHAEILTEMYGMKTRILGDRFAKKTIAQLHIELSRLKTIITSITQVFHWAIEQVDGKIGALVANDAAQNFQPFLERYYDPKHVRAVTSTLLRDKDAQEKAMRQIRISLLERVEGGPTLSSFDASFGLGHLINALEEICHSTVEEAHDHRISDQRDKILTSQILERLYNEYFGRDAELQEFIDSMIDQATLLAAFDETERTRGDAPVQSIRGLTAFIPSADTLPESKRVIHGLVVKAIRSHVHGELAIVETRESPHEISFITVENLFPLRILTGFKNLRRHYDELVEGAKGPQKRLEIHLEGDGTEYPAADLPTARERQQASLRYWLIAEAADLLTAQENRRSGMPEVTIKWVSDHVSGRESVIKIGETLEKRVDHINDSSAYYLRKVVTEYLSTLEHRRDREAVMKTLADLEKEELEKCKGDTEAAAYRSIQSGVNGAFRLLQRPSSRSVPRTVQGNEP